VAPGTFESCVDLTDDGSTTWHTLTDWTWSRGPVTEQVDLSGYAGKTVQVRWRYSTNGQYGQYQQQIDNVKMTTACLSKAKTGSLIVGHVYDANTKLPLAGITVANELSQTATSDASGLFSLFSTGGTHTLTATPSSGSTYGTASLSASIPSKGGVMKRDFSLPAGKLVASPTQMTVTVTADSSTTKTLSMANKGGKAVSATLSQTDTSTGTAATWLSISPRSGTVATGGHLPVTLTFNAAGMQAGTYTASITIYGNTPYASLAVPVTMVVKAKKGS